MSTPTDNQPHDANESRPRGTGPFYLVALMCSGLSLDTAARYFHGHMGINGLPIHGISAELAAICGIGELTLVACGYAMRHNVRRGGKPGAAQLVALAMCSAATFMAIALDGPIAGALRAFFGPILALITLHLALGIEVKVRRGINTGTWARIGAEIRERVLSRIGLGDDERKAAERSRDRARDRAARLATAGWVPFKEARLVRAVRASGATLDPEQRGRLVEQVAVLKNITDLTAVDVESPWNAAVPAHVQRLVDAAQRSIDAQRAAAAREAADALAAAEAAAAALRREAQQQADAQHRTAAQHLAAAEADAARIRAAAERAAAAERHAAEESRRRAEEHAQQQNEQLIAAARAEAAEIRSAARADAQVLRTVVRTPAPQQSIRTVHRVAAAPFDAADGASVADPETLADALDKQWPTEIPSQRKAGEFLRERFGKCSDDRVRKAIAALQQRRGDAPSDADAERLQLTVPNTRQGTEPVAGHVNGHRPNLEPIGATA